MKKPHNPVLSIIDRRLGFFAEIHQTNGEYVSVVAEHGELGKKRLTASEDVYMDFDAMLRGWHRILTRYIKLLQPLEDDGAWIYLGIHMVPPKMNRYWKSDVVLSAAGATTDNVREASLIDRINGYALVITSKAKGSRDEWTLFRPNIGADLREVHGLDTRGIKETRSYAKYDIQTWPRLRVYMLGEFMTYLYMYTDEAEESF